MRVWVRTSATGLCPQVDRVDAHQDAITDLCLDSQAEWLASSAANGTVHVHNLYNAAEPITMQFDRQVNVRTSTPH